MVTPKESVDAAVVAYVNGGIEALQAVTGPDPVDSPVFWEAIQRIGANRRALATGRRYRAGIDSWDRLNAAREEARGDSTWVQRGGNV